MLTIFRQQLDVKKNRAENSCGEVERESALSSARTAPQDAARGHNGLRHRATILTPR